MVGNGNHWTYFAFSTAMDELYYGDSLGWRLPSNLLSVMKKGFEMLCTATGKAYVKSNNYSSPNALTNGIKQAA